MSSNYPRVSICIPTYNRADMVGCAIGSALAQTYQDIEVVVVDNASKDNIEEVVASFKDPRLRFVKNEENLGLFGNFNRCIEVAQGEFLHILHSDDYIDPDFTETCLAFFDEHPKVVLTFTSSITHIQDHEIEGHYAKTDMILPATDGFQKLLRERCFITCPSVMTRKEVYQQAGKYSLEFPYSSDYYQWLKISRILDIAYVKDTRVHYRQGEHSESHRLLFTNPSGYLDTLKIFVQIIRDLGDEYPLYTSDLNCALRRYIGDCFYAGFTRVDGMRGFHPSLFSGLAILAWTLTRPQSLQDIVVKIVYRLFIFGGGVAMYLSPLRRICKNLLKRGEIPY
ncbi:glycosyltransferase family 2 protein [Methanocalculus sp.]|uniref:glycosyltransferase family 2 protein n=1 Tax=Methanocalculus sp. TaxID=2004547 RepID=UPI00261EDFB9|nr:glycosyltransferase family 2 protein [Methanocalculus sp.]MDG6249887.1 glycosyltransferase family 2 protein [Methanocalculus sp.]